MPPCVQDPSSNNSCAECYITVCLGAVDLLHVSQSLYDGLDVGCPGDYADEKSLVHCGTGGLHLAGYCGYECSAAGAYGAG